MENETTPPAFDPTTVEVPPVPEHLQTLYTAEQWRAIVIGDLQAAHDRKLAALKRAQRGNHGAGN